MYIYANKLVQHKRRRALEKKDKYVHDLILIHTYKHKQNYAHVYIRKYNHTCIHTQA